MRSPTAGRARSKRPPKIAYPWQAHGKTRRVRPPATTDLSGGSSASNIRERPRKSPPSASREHKGWTETNLAPPQVLQPPWRLLSSSQHLLRSDSVPDRADISGLRGRSRCHAERHKVAFFLPPLQCYGKLSLPKNVA